MNERVSRDSPLHLHNSNPELGAMTSLGKLSLSTPRLIPPASPSTARTRQVYPLMLWSYHVLISLRVGRDIHMKHIYYCERPMLLIQTFNSRAHLEHCVIPKLLPDVFYS
jgi:hypothetical protein